MLFPTFFTQYHLRLCDKLFTLFWLILKLFKVSNLNYHIFFVPSVAAALGRSNFHELKTNNKKVIKRQSNKKATKTE